MDKQTLRRWQMERRKNLDGDEKTRREQRIHRQLIDFLKPYDSIAVYLSMDFEVDTQCLIESLVHKRLSAPIVIGDAIQFHPLGSKRVKHRFGMDQPQATSAIIPEVIVVPLLAFNQRGYRIGFGKGFYDDYLKDFKGITIGLAFSTDGVDFYEDTWDQALNYIVTDKEIIKFT